MVKENGLGFSNFELNSTNLFKGLKTFWGYNKEKHIAVKKIKRAKRMNFLCSPIEMVAKKSYFNESLDFLSIEGIYKAMGFTKRDSNYPQLTDHYFTGDYPVKPIDELGDDKITQLSLLSTGSNN